MKDRSLLTEVALEVSRAMKELRKELQLFAPQPFMKQKTTREKAMKIQGGQNGNTVVR